MRAPDVHRRNRLQFGGSVELHEVKMPRIQVHSKPSVTEDPNDGTASSSSSRASSASRATGSEAKIGVDLSELGLVRALARSFLFAGSGLAVSLQTSLMDIVELLISRAEEIYGKFLVHRFCVFVIISRQGLLEQDLYELLNAAMQQKVVMGNCRSVAVKLIFSDQIWCQAIVVCRFFPAESFFWLRCMIRFLTHASWTSTDALGKNSSASNFTLRPFSRRWHMAIWRFWCPRELLYSSAFRITSRMR